MACSMRGPPSSSSDARRCAGSMRRNSPGACGARSRPACRPSPRRSGRRRSRRRSATRARAPGRSPSRPPRSASRMRRRISKASSSVFRPGAKARPVVVAEVAVGGAGGHDQVVVGQARSPSASMHLRAAGIDGVDFAEQRRDVGLLAEQVAHRRRDRRRGQAGGGHLVEQGLEQVVVGACRPA